MDECAEPGAGAELCPEPNTQCLNSPGSYQCVCGVGFYWSHAGFVCVGNCLVNCLLVPWPRPDLTRP